MTSTTTDTQAAASARSVWPRTTAVLAGVCLIAGPVLIALALATLVDPWNGDVPNHVVIDQQHGQLLLSFNLAAAAFPFLLGSVVALAAPARRAPLLSGIGLACSVLGLCAMAANSTLSVPLVLMNGITGHDPLDVLATRLSAPPLLMLWLFPLFVVGAIVQAIALRRSRTVPLWSAVCLALGGLIPVAMLVDVGVLALPFAALRIAGSIPVIATMWRPTGAH